MAFKVVNLTRGNFCGKKAIFASNFRSSKKLLDDYLTSA